MINGEITLLEKKLEIKKKGLQILVDNEIFTEEEYDCCVGALKELYGIEDLDSDEIQVEIVDDYIYEDEIIRVKYKGLRRITNLFFGAGYDIRFIVENKSSFNLKVSAIDISSNDFVLEDDGYIVSDLAPYKKAVDGVGIYDGTLNDCDIYDIDDFGELEFRIKYEIQELDGHEKISSTIRVEAYEG